MVIAALISFGILLVAWILAPDDGTPRTTTVSSREPLPVTT